MLPNGEELRADLVNWSNHMTSNMTPKMADITSVKTPNGANRCVSTHRGKYSVFSQYLLGSLAPALLATELEFGSNVTPEDPMELFVTQGTIIQQETMQPV